MDPVAERLQHLLPGVTVRKVDECVGGEARQAVDALGEGEILLLENVRFYPDEEKNGENFARQLAQLGEVYVNDAFGAAHRAHASTEGVAGYMPAVAGFLMEKEIFWLRKNGIPKPYSHLPSRNKKRAGTTTSTPRIRSPRSSSRLHPLVFSSGYHRLDDTLLPFIQESEKNQNQPIKNI